MQNISVRTLVFLPYVLLFTRTAQAACNNAQLGHIIKHLIFHFRRMFPILRVKISDLDPHAHYCIFMQMSPASTCRYKYSPSCGWTPSGSQESQSPLNLYMHPESPATGEHWMSQPVAFGKLKLTNTTTPPPGQVVLTSMHKYQPKIIVVKTSNPGALGYAPSDVAVFEETQFIAVTAYQVGVQSVLVSRMSYKG